MYKTGGLTPRRSPSCSCVDSIIDLFPTCQGRGFVYNRRCVPAPRAENVGR